MDECIWSPIQFFDCAAYARIEPARCLHPASVCPARSLVRVVACPSQARPGPGGPRLCGSGRGLRQLLPNVWVGLLDLMPGEGSAYGPSSLSLYQDG